MTSECEVVDKLNVLLSKILKRDKDKDVEKVKQQFQEESIEYENLLLSGEEELREILTDAGVKALQRKRIIDYMLTNPDSKMFKNKYPNKNLPIKQAQAQLPDVSHNNNNSNSDSNSNNNINSIHKSESESECETDTGPSHNKDAGDTGFPLAAVNLIGDNPILGTFLFDANNNDPKHVAIQTLKKNKFADENNWDEYKMRVKFEHAMQVHLQPLIKHKLADKYMKALLISNFEQFLEEVREQNQREWQVTKSKRLKMAGAALVTTATVASAVVFAPVILGFGSAGVVGGSIAAGIQASMGNIVAGSAFAIMQSVGMGGAWATTYAAFGGAAAVATGTVATGVTAAVTESAKTKTIAVKEDEDDKNKN